MRFYYILFFQLVFFARYSDVVGQNSNYDKSYERIYQEGMESIIKSNYSAARKHFDDYLQLANPVSENSINAEYYRAFAALNLYNNNGEYLIGKFIEKYPNHPKSLDANFELGKFYYAENNPTKAIKYLTEAEKASGGKSERNTEIKYKLGYSFFSKRKFEEAILRFNSIKEINGQYYAASNYYAGYIEYEQGLFDQALIDLKKAERSEGYKLNVPYMICTVYYNNSNYSELLKYAEVLLGSGSAITNRNSVLLLVADANYHLEKFDIASKYYSEYLTKINNANIDIPLQYRIGYVAYLNKENDQAIEFFKKVASVDKTELGYYSSYYLGVLYAESDKKMFAITAFDKARKMKTDKNVAEESLFQFAKLNYELGRADQAISGLEKYKSEFGSGKHMDEVDDIISEVYLHTNNYDKALAYIEPLKNRSEKVNKVYQKASFHKGVNEFNKSNYAEAVSLFKKSLSVPSDKEIEIKTNYWLAEAYAIVRKNDEALSHYQKVIWNANDNVVEKSKARYGLGYLHYNAKDYQKALASFKSYIDTNSPESNIRMYDDALIRLADCYYVSKNYKNAITIYKQSLSLSRADNDYTELQLGIIYGIEGQHNKAINSYNNVINNYSNTKYDDDAIYYKAQLKFEIGEFENAIKDFSILISSKRKGRFTPYAYLKRATAYSNLTQYTKAIDDYQLLITDYSSHKLAQQALLPLQEALASENRSAEFDEYLAIFKQANPDNKSTESIEFESAKTLYYNQQFELATNKLLSFLDNYPESSMRLEAHFFLGEVSNSLGNTDDALNYYSIIIENEDYEQYNRVVGRMAKIEQQEQRFDNAMYYYNKLLAAANNKKEQNNALVGMMVCTYYLTSFDSCRQYAEQLLALGTANANDQNKASLYLGKAAMAIGDFQRAKDEFLQTLNTAKDEHGAEAQYLIGEILYLEKEYEKSIEALVELNNSFYSYEYWLGKGFLLIVDNYIVTEEYFQAKGTLNSIIEGFPREDIVEIAKIKLKEIESLEDVKIVDEMDSSLVEMDTTYVENK